MKSSLLAGMATKGVARLRNGGFLNRLANGHRMQCHVDSLVEVEDREVPYRTCLLMEVKQLQTLSSMYSSFLRHGAIPCTAKHSSVCSSLPSSGAILFAHEQHPVHFGSLQETLPHPSARSTTSPPPRPLAWLLGA